MHLNSSRSPRVLLGATWLCLFLVRQVTGQTRDCLEKVHCSGHGLCLYGKEGPLCSCDPGYETRKGHPRECTRWMKFGLPTWSDEFDGNVINDKKWQHEVDCFGGGNAELQCYTNRTANSFVERGRLHLKVIKEDYRGTEEGCTNNKDDSCTWARKFTSARLITQHNVGKNKGAIWMRGRAQIRAKLPRGSFLWPAIWMLPQIETYGGWAASGEIDIMEARGQVPGKVEGTLHHGGSWPLNAHTGSGPQRIPGIDDFTAGFHVFELRWTEHKMVWLVDGVKYHTQDLDRDWSSEKGKSPYETNGQPWDQKFFMILNIAVGGDFFEGTEGWDADSQTLDPDVINYGLADWTDPVMQVDYVRIWEEGKFTPDTPAPPQPIAAPPPPAPPPVSPPGEELLAETTVGSAAVGIREAPQRCLSAVMFALIVALRFEW